MAKGQDKLFVLIGLKGEVFLAFGSRRHLTATYPDCRIAEVPVEEGEELALRALQYLYDNHGELLERVAETAVKLSGTPEKRHRGRK